MKEIETLSLMHIASGESYFKIPLSLIRRERSGDYFDFLRTDWYLKKVATETLIFFGFAHSFSGLAECEQNYQKRHRL